MQFVQHLQVPHERIVLVECLAKAKTWVKDDVADSQFMKSLHFASHISQQLCHESSIVRLVDCSVVRQHVGDTQFCHSPEHVSIKVASADVVHNLHTKFLYAHLGNLSPECIDAYDGFRSFIPNDGQCLAKPTHLFLLVWRCVARSGRASTDIQDGCALREYLSSTRSDVFGSFVMLIEGVGRCI